MARLIAFRIEAPAEHALDFNVRVQVPTGVSTERFAKNPVVMFGHAGESIGTVRELDIVDRVLTGRVRLASGNDSAGLVRRMRAGLIRYAELAVDDAGDLLELSVIGPFGAGSELAQQLDADDAPRVLGDGERLCPCTSVTGSRIAGDGERLCPTSLRLTDAKETHMPTPKDDSPVSRARAELAAREGRPLPPLALSKATLDAKEPGLLAELQELIRLAKAEGLSLDAVLSALEDLSDIRRAESPDATVDARDASPVAAARSTLAERRRSWPKRFGFGSGGDAA